MGALVTRALRPIRSFNIENRAHRVISKEKPTPAPRYPDNIEDLKRTLELEPDIADKLDKKDPGLDNRLRDVYVTSHGRPEDDITRELRDRRNENRPLPQDRTQLEDYEFGFKEPEKVKYGRTTLRQVIDFISAHQTDPKQVTAAKIAFEYKMKEEDVDHILKYFKTFEVYIPETKKTPAIFAGPTQIRKQIEKSNLVKEIENKSDENVDSKESRQKID